MRDIDIEIVDNFFSPTYFSKIKDFVTQYNFSWNFRKDVTTNEAGKNNSLFDYGLNLEIRSDTNFGQFIGPAIFMMQDHAGCSSVYRARLDMTFYAGKTPHRHQPHIDLPYPNISAIFYITESDGPTVIFDQKVSSSDEDEKFPYAEDHSKLKNGEYDISSLSIKKEIDPKPNRVLFFSGDYIHTGHSPFTYKNRLLMNCNFGTMI